jgi:precorrin-6A synthase
MGDRQVRRVFVIGIGSGDPEHLTLGAVRALNETDVVFRVDKGEAGTDIDRARMSLCEHAVDPSHEYRVSSVVLTAVRDRDQDAPYSDGVAGWRRERIEAYEQLIAGLAPDETGAFLVWGDPSLYDGTLAILDEVRAGGGVEFTVDVIPGVSSMTALAARHAVPLCRAGETVLITTGRRLARDGVPDQVDNIVVMLDAHDAWAAMADESTVWWGAFVGLDGEQLIAGRLGDKRAAISSARAEARRDRGWLFDTFLVRPAPDE